MKPPKPRAREKSMTTKRRKAREWWLSVESGHLHNTRKGAVKFAEWWGDSNAVIKVREVLPKPKPARGKRGR